MCDDDGAWLPGPLSVAGDLLGGMASLAGGLLGGAAGVVGGAAPVACVVLGGCLVAGFVIANAVLLGALAAVFVSVMTAFLVWSRRAANPQKFAAALAEARAARTPLPRNLAITAGQRQIGARPARVLDGLPLLDDVAGPVPVPKDG